jgi:hypothetical protein
MIKDKITPDLKKILSETIKKTEYSGNEHGFFMCLNKDGKLSASKIKCEGDKCKIDMRLSKETCPDNNQGFFHVHPEKLNFEKILGIKITADNRKNIVITDGRGKIITAHSPSHLDVLTMFITKCNKLSEGTICTAGDIIPDKVECWTPKKGAVNPITCYYAKKDISTKEKKDVVPKTWIKYLFNKEIIDLGR